jgi:hypothetical protein
MKSKLWKFAAAFAVFALLFTACPGGDGGGNGNGNGNGNDPDPNNPGDGLVPLTGFSIDKTVIVERDKTVKLTPVFTPSNASDTRVEYVSSDPLYVSVDEDGNVTGNFKGISNITAKPLGASSLVQTVKVTVDNPKTDTLPISIALKEGSGSESTSFSVNVGEDLQLTVVWGTTPTVRDFTWEPANAPNIESKRLALSKAFPYIDNQNRPMLRGVGPGTQQFTITSLQDNDVSKTITLTVNNRAGYQNPVDVTYKNPDTPAACIDADDYRWEYSGSVVYRPAVRDMKTADGRYYAIFDTTNYKYNKAWQDADDKDNVTTPSILAVYIYWDYSLTLTNSSPWNVIGNDMNKTEWSLGTAAVVPGQAVFRIEIPLKTFLALEQKYADKLGENYENYENTDDFYQKHNGGHATEGTWFFDWGLARPAIKLITPFANAFNAGWAGRCEIWMAQ